MNSDSSIGLAVIGQFRLAEHLFVLKGLKDVQLVGISQEETDLQQPISEALSFAHRDELLNHPDVLGVVVCVPPDEREHWIQQVVLAGKHVFCIPPIALTYPRACKLVESCKESGASLAVLADVLFSSIGTTVSRLVHNQEIGSLLFFDLKVSLPQKWLRDEREGLLLLQGIHYLSLIIEYFGPIDSVYARTRSLGLNRPVEDVVVVQLRFKQGLEAVVHMNGLGDGEEVVLQLYGCRGTVEIRADLLEVFREGLQFQYSDFVQAVKMGKKPVFDGAKAVASQYLVEWIQQSARQDREVFRKEVRIG